ncbi:MAG: alanine--tRNA ligase [Thermodesulfobacteriota bacterium]|nr:MAG: alanine--tRNA ligase [Thermodesulfobacteriota bacterium]
MDSAEIRKKFLDYFAERGHRIVPSSPLVPEQDPTLLFTNAGMVQFKGVFLEDEKRDYKRAATCQKCVRAGGKHNDLENVGVTARHHTFFEMLGNFSFGDYFKETAVEYAWDFLTRELGLDGGKLWATVYEDDDEAEKIWLDNIGLPKERVVRMGAKDNFWSMGEVGPCGPCSEILIDQGAEAGCGSAQCAVGCDCDRYLEIWNLVFMQFNRDAEGKLTPLPKPSIDTGMGLERLSAVMQSKKSNYDTDLFTPIINLIEKITSVRYGTDHEKDISIRAVADHCRAVSFLIADGVLPGNVGRNYVLRRIIRRGVRHGRFLGLHEPFMYKVNEKVLEIMGGVYPELRRASDLIREATKGEEERFFETLERGLELLEGTVRRLEKEKKKVIPGEFAFKLYDTFGFPLDLTADIVKREGLTVDEEGFSKFMESQRAQARRAWKGGEVGGGEGLYKTLARDGLKSRFTGYHVDAASSRVLCIIKDAKVVDSAGPGDVVEVITEETPFYGESGGQAGDRGIIISKDIEILVTDTKRPLSGLTVHHCEIKKGEIKTQDHVELVPDIERRAAIRRNHTATHIIHAILRKTLGEHVRQSGSFVGSENFRFDFNHFHALGYSDLLKIEEEANAVVLDNIEVQTDEMAYQEAIEAGALAFFGEKYSGIVRLVQVPGVSKELCGGTHVRRTGDIGLIKIIGESSVAAGVRRIEAVTGLKALEKVEGYESALRDSSEILKVPLEGVAEKIKKLMERQRDLEREIEKLKAQRLKGAATDLAASAREVNDIKVIASKVETADPKQLREMADNLRRKLGSGIVVLGGSADGKAVLIAAVTKDLTKRFSAGAIVKRLSPLFGGRGGGKPDLAQAGGGDPAKLAATLEGAYGVVEEMASEKP